MIKVNLVGASRKKSVKGPGKSIALPKSVMPVVLLAIVLGFAGGGYFWYASLSGQSAALASQIDALTKQKKDLDAVIKLDQKFEERKIVLENRVNVIEKLKRDQVTPVMSLDMLSEAIDRTEYIWLSSLTQNNNTFSMSGTGTSMIAIADFVTNLGATGYFPRVELNSAAESGTTVTFSITAEYVPPQQQAAAAATKGGEN